MKPQPAAGQFNLEENKTKNSKDLVFLHANGKNSCHASLKLSLFYSHV